MTQNDQMHCFRIRCHPPVRSGHRIEIRGSASAAGLCGYIWVSHSVLESTRAESFFTTGSFRFQIPPSTGAPRQHGKTTLVSGPTNGATGMHARKPVARIVRPKRAANGDEALHSVVYVARADRRLTGGRSRDVLLAGNAPSVEESGTLAQRKQNADTSHHLQSEDKPIKH